MNTYDTMTGLAFRFNSLARSDETKQVIQIIGRLSIHIAKLLAFLLVLGCLYSYLFVTSDRARRFYIRFWGLIKKAALSPGRFGIPQQVVDGAKDIIKGFLNYLKNFSGYLDVEVQRCLRTEQDTIQTEGIDDLESSVVALQEKPEGQTVALPPVEFMSKPIISSLDNLTIRQLKQLGKEKKLPNYGRMQKTQLIETLSN